MFIISLHNYLLGGYILKVTRLVEVSQRPDYLSTSLTSGPAVVSEFCTFGKVSCNWQT